MPSLCSLWAPFSYLFLSLSLCGFTPFHGFYFFFCIMNNHHGKVDAHNQITQNVAGKENDIKRP